ncbi:MAG: prepilin-type cleavage/methylation domain-containing protein, partial [Moorella sp. (in: Bacteria)]|nr:prepilin-type cleavage/methylation domain-containing protein [Moorella sp. (in: firmicutes)]
YAVTEALAEPGTYDRDEGAIYVRDSNNNEIARDPSTLVGGVAHYVLVSHGANNSGATAIGGGGTTPCTAGTLEEENCNNDENFRSTLLLGTADNASLYDDLISFRAISAFGNEVPPGAVIPFNLSACPEGWIRFSSAEDRFVVGAGSTHNVGDEGGEEEWELDAAETGTSPTLLYFNPADTAFAGAGGVPVREHTGVFAPHENMPPYISLL